MDATIPPPHPNPHAPHRFAPPPGRVRRALPHLRPRRQVPVRRRPGVHAAGLRHRRLRTPATAPRVVPGGVRTGQLPRDRQLGDGRRAPPRAGSLRRRGDDRRIVQRRRHRRVPRRRRARHAVQLRRPPRRRAGARRVLADRPPRRAVRLAHRPAFRRQGPHPLRVAARRHAVRVRHRPHGAGRRGSRRRAGAVPPTARADGRRPLLGEDLGRRAAHGRRNPAVRRRRPVPRGRSSPPHPTACCGAPTGRTRTCATWPTTAISSTSSPTTRPTRPPATGSSSTTRPCCTSSAVRLQLSSRNASPRASTRRTSYGPRIE